MLNYSSLNISTLDAYTLNGMALGYAPEDAPLVGTFIAPVVEVPRVGSIIQFGKEAFSIANSSRAYGGRVKQVSSAFSNLNYTLEGHALAYEIPVEMLEEINAISCINDEAISLREIEIYNILQRLARGHELSVVNLVTASATYETGNYFAGITNALPGALDWTAANSTPIDNIARLQSVIRRKIGARPNAMVIGSTVYERLISHPDVVARVQYTSTDSINQDIIARFFGVKKVMVADAVYLDEATGDLTSLFPENGLLLFYSPNPQAENVTLTATKSVTRMKPASFLTYQIKGGWKTSAEQFYDITSNGESAGVIKAVVGTEYKVLPVGLGPTQKVVSAMYINNVFA